MNVYFSDYFEINPELLEQYGAFNISLINDLPLFVDPFLLFESEKEEYKQLHKNILKYVGFLRDMSIEMTITDNFLKNWFMFSEVKQNWLGYSLIGNAGSGLGLKFAISLQNNLHNIFSEFGKETITLDGHLEKLCIIKSGIGRDNISDFTVNLIKEYICEYTENFAKQYISKDKRTKISVDKVTFDYLTKRWKPKTYDLPFIDDAFVLLTPKDILTKDENWINSKDIIKKFYDIANSISNSQLRTSISLYFEQNLPKLTEKKKKITAKEFNLAVQNAVEKYPELLDYYIRFKEDNGKKATSISKENVEFIETIFINELGNFINNVNRNTNFYIKKLDTYKESLERVMYLKMMDIKYFM